MIDSLEAKTKPTIKTQNEGLGLFRNIIYSEIFGLGVSALQLLVPYSFFCISQAAEVSNSILIERAERPGFTLLLFHPSWALTADMSASAGRHHIRVRTTMPGGFVAASIPHPETCYFYLCSNLLD